MTRRALILFVLALHIAGCGPVNKFILWQEYGKPDKVLGPSLECYDWSVESEGNFLNGTLSVADHEAAARQYRALLSIEKDGLEPFERNCFWTEYLWSKANFAACNGDEQATDAALEALISLPIETPQTCNRDCSDHFGLIWRRVITSRILADAHVAAARRFGEGRARPRDFHEALERELVRAKAAIREHEAVVATLRVVGSIVEGVERGLRSQSMSSAGSLQTSRAAETSQTDLVCPDNGTSCRDDPSVRQWRSRCESQTNAQGPCYCVQAAVFSCYIQRGCYEELAGARAAGLPLARLEGNRREAIGLANRVGTACTAIPGPEQPVFDNSSIRRPLVPRAPAALQPNRDCDVPSGATACPAF